MNIRIIAVIAALAVVAACKKERTGEGTVPPSGKYFTVILNPDYLPLASIDSAFITWQQGTKTDSVRLMPRGNDLAVSFDGLPSEEKTYQVHLYTAQKIKFYKLYWQKELVVALGQKNALNVVAPLDLQDANWLPRVILNDQSGLVAFSGIRPADPYFRIHQIDQSWKEILVDRSYWHTDGPDTKVAGGVWKGNNILDATGSYENKSFFTFLPAQIGGRVWDHIEIVLLFTNAANTQTRILDFTYTVE